METADSLRIKFGCKDDAELGELFGRTGGAVSVWRKNGLPAAIEKRAYELMAERGIAGEPLTPYSRDMSLVPPGLAHEDIDKFFALPRVTQAMMARVMGEMKDLPEEEQWRYATEWLKNLHKKEGE